ncbi:MAG: putative toxin-antitoxin system toxin component, PIN family [Gammaproteobacteria bacterium]
MSKRGPAYQALKLVEDQEIELLLSDAILSEVAEVLNRPQFRAKFPGLNDEVVSQFLSHLRSVGFLVEAVPDAVQLLRDPDDEPYVNLAIAAKARYLVTRDLDLLDLPTANSGLELPPDLRILTPVAFLTEIKRSH